jgi:hypothetical protein
VPVGPVELVVPVEQSGPVGPVGRIHGAGFVGIFSRCASDERDRKQAGDKDKRQAS